MSLPIRTLEQRAAFAELLGRKHVDVLLEMLSMAHKPAIEAQFDEHVGTAPHQRTESRRDVRNGSRSRGLNTRAGSIGLKIPRTRNAYFSEPSSSISPQRASVVFGHN